MLGVEVPRSSVNLYMYPLWAPATETRPGRTWGNCFLDVWGPWDPGHLDLPMTAWIQRLKPLHGTLRDGQPTALATILL